MPEGLQLGKCTSAHVPSAQHPWKVSQSVWGAARHSQLSYVLKKEVAGEGSDGLPLLQEEGMPSASARVPPHRLPAIPSHFFSPRDNSLNKLGSIGVANLPADFGTQTGAP